MVLVFTVATFWWLNAGQDRLRSFAPQSLAAAAPQHLTVLRLPIVFYKTGAKPIIVQDLQIRFLGELDPALPWSWRNSWPQLRPMEDDKASMPAVFAVAGRSTEQLFIEFGPRTPGFVPEMRDYRVRLEARLGHRGGWRPVLTFTPVPPT
ncbi:hypothetical protein [Streptomyces xantholiticus]|uniref:hypothetical protein n=1 Tax=Streptomyces xantholiticus TaxID=68285 RepID=UPI00167756DD|nr:hypothetical protein [Streptomyces xantholiticus]GGW60485.1 hypothetical protein GCM10010381_52220 [Streptomyces xantholiticus]